MIKSLHTVSVFILLMCMCLTCKIYVNGESIHVSFDEDHFEDEEIIDLDFNPIERTNLKTSKIPNPKRKSSALEEILKRIQRGGASSQSNDNSEYSQTYYHANRQPHSYKKRRRKRPKSSQNDGVINEDTESHKSSSFFPEETVPHIPPTKITVNIQGYGKAEGRREQAVDTWKGIPYASPPVGSLRFAPPEAATPWHPSKLDASQFGPDCYQLADPVLNPLADESQMSEDCLYLNIFTPAGHVARSHGKFLNGGKKLPVMLWFHGGAFQQGAGRRPEYDGRKLAERDLIVVTINYRLGALGFLVSSPDGLYGNFGLMDQRAALDWVKKNIEAFGGDSNNITLFGESAGAVMIGLHLLMEGAGTLFHKAIMQSNPLGYTFRSVVVADFIGEALKRNVDCRDLACLRAERVEEIMRAQSSLMGVPRSVGDFFTFGPTLTSQRKVKFSLTGESRFFSRSEENRLPRLDTDESQNSFVSEWRVSSEINTDTARWSAVNVSQPLKMLHNIPDDIPLIIGTTRHEGEMFVHSAFNAPMPKPVYWMFVGALFRDSSSKVLRHYRGLVSQIEQEAEELAKKQIEEEENKQNYLANQEMLDREYELLLALNKTGGSDDENVNVIGSDGVRTLVNTWSTGGFQEQEYDTITSSNYTIHDTKPSFRHSLRERFIAMAKSREEKRIIKMKERALKEAAKVVVDYRPVMSAIISDYLFRCPSWHFAQLLTRLRSENGKHTNNVYVYRFSLPTHIPGYKECWGKSCHTAELPYVFQSMDIIRSNYSTLGPYAQEEAPGAPEYPYSQIMNAYRGALEALQIDDDDDDDDITIREEVHDDLGGINGSSNHTKAFQRILSHFFGDYFKEDADEEMASDMSERWANFAKFGNPNYDGSKAEWLPWRHQSENSTFFDQDAIYDSSSQTDDANTWPDEEYDYWSDDYDEFVDTDEELVARDEYYRRRALEALEMDVAAEDVFTTELRRVQYKDSEEVETSFLKGKMLKRFRPEHQKPMHLLSKAEATEAIRIAQQFGLLGSGLFEDMRGAYANENLQSFFPELLELSWPPEGRLIERDCTCDMWDRIRYRY